MVSLYFGLPGCGKTTLATSFAIEAQKKIDKGRSKYKYVFTNFPVNYPNIYSFEKEDLGNFEISDALLIIDEATLLADSRDYKSFTKELKRFFLLHRHWKIDVILFTQQWDGVDKKIRNITNKVFYCYKGMIFRNRTYAVRVPYGLTFPNPDENEYGDIIQGYKKPSFFDKLFRTHISRRKYYKYFDSYEAPPLESKQFLTWI